MILYKIVHGLLFIDKSLFITFYWREQQDLMEYPRTYPPLL